MKTPAFAQPFGIMVKYCSALESLKITAAFPPPHGPGSMFLRAKIERLQNLNYARPPATRGEVWWTPGKKFQFKKQRPP